MTLDRALHPLLQAERSELLDILRGFALMGMLVSHVTSGGSVLLLPRADEVVDLALEWLVEDSFAPLFAFLFGHGFAVQSLRAFERGLRIGGLYLRRLVVLFLIGTVHAIFVTDGDILVQYALLGIVLIPCHRVSPRLVLAAVLLLFTVQVTEQPLRRAVAHWQGVPAGDWQAAEELREVRLGRAQAEWALRGRPAAAAPRFVEDVHRRWNVYREGIRHQTDWRRLPFSGTLLLFLAGLYAGRRRWLLDAARHRTGLRHALVLASLLALGGTLYGAQTSHENSLASTLAARFADLGVTGCSVTAIALATTAGGKARRLLSVLAPAGMMALTTYLVQSLAISWPFLPYGVGLPMPGATVALLLALAFFFLVQVPFGWWWMKRFRFGPVEWFWRSATYLRFQPLRRVPAEAVVLSPTKGGG